MVTITTSRALAACWTVDAVARSRRPAASDSGLRKLAIEPGVDRREVPREKLPCDLSR
jgi:hypothetical protein